MATGDIKNNIRKLISELRHIKHDYKKVDFDSLTHGNPSAFLPILHYVFLDYSHELASFLAGKSYDFYGRTDLRFMETVYKLLMQEFSYKPSLTKEQFLALGFAERKIIAVIDIVRFARQKHESLCKKKKKPPTAKRAQIVSKDGYLDSTVNTEIRSAVHTAVIEHSPKKENPTVVRHKGSQKQDSSVTSSEVKQNGASANLKFEKKRALHSPVGSKTRNSSHNGGSKQKCPLLRPELPAQLPQPCLSLTVTPLKDQLNQHYGTEMQQSVSDESSRAIPIDVDDEPISFKITKHKSSIPVESSESEERPVRDQVNRSLAFQKYQHQEDESKMPLFNSGSIGSNDNVIDIQKLPHSSDLNSDPRCKESANLAKLQIQVEELTASVRDLVLINNDLSARVVLLETKNKLMEEKFDLLEEREQLRNDATGDFDEGSFLNEKEARGSLKDIVRSQTDEEDAARSKRRVDFVSHSEDNDLASYSPDKYTDDYNPLPLDFQPIQLEQLASEASFDENIAATDENDQTEDTRYNAATSILNGVSSVRDPNNEAPSLPSKLLHQQEAIEALSPLKNADYSFMQQGTKDRILNVQQRLEETMNLLKKSTAVFAARDKTETES